MLVDASENQRSPTLAESNASQIMHISCIVMIMKEPGFHINILIDFLNGI